MVSAMKHHTQVVEAATAENFFPEGYLLANPDVRKVFGASASAARQHYRSHGYREHRNQVTRGFLDTIKDPGFRRGRFERFRHCFEAVPTGDLTFPVCFGSLFESIDNYESESSHPTAPAFSDELTAHPDRLYADVGAGLRNVMFDNCIYVEVYPSLTTDVVVEPNSKLPLRDGVLDGIGCYAVLEHVREPWAMAKEFARVVKPGGKIFIDWPFLQPVHGYPSHYYNATPEGLRALFERDFAISSLQTGVHQGPDFTVNWIIGGLLRAIRDPAIRQMVASKTVAELVEEKPQGDFWQKVLNSVDEQAVATFSCGNTLIGVRKDR